MDGWNEQLDVILQINIVAYLAQLGYQPKRVSRGYEYWFISLLRDEPTPSFKVDNRSNLVSTCLGVQNADQLRKDYGREQADVIMNLVGNIIIGHASGERLLADPTLQNLINKKLKGADGYGTTPAVLI